MVRQRSPSAAGRENGVDVNILQAQLESPYLHCERAKKPRSMNMQHLFAKK